jgi:hypothetical protein
MGINVVEYERVLADHINEKISVKLYAILLMNYNHEWINLQ